MNAHRRKKAVPVIILIAGILFSILITVQVCRSQEEEKRETVQSVAHSRAVMFQQLIDKRISAENTLYFIIYDRNGDISGMDPVFRELYRNTSSFVSGYMLSPDGIMRYAYPDEDTPVKGTDLFADAHLGKYYSYYRDVQQTFLRMETDPDNNSSSIVFSMPVYMREKGTDYQNFWGFVTVVSPLQTMLDDARISELSDTGHQYRLTMHSNYGREDHVLAESDPAWDSSTAESYTIEEPGYTFTLSIAPKSGWVRKDIIFWTLSASLVLTAAVTFLAVNAMRLRQSNRLLEEISMRDSLTGLPNRRSFISSLGMLSASQQPFTIFFMDANRFKDINDTYGHEAGDAALKEIAVRLSNAFDGCACRLGGDEFGAWVPSRMSDEDVKRLIHRLNSLMQEPFSWHDQSVSISVSTGWCLSETGAGIDELLQKADQMMYQNKKAQHENRS